jgi:ATPase family protein associated with various cellular activities (AAA)
VYLPLIGDNLAKQLGAAGEAKRTDQMGLLLLISPPGYGKTTLMEYVASRLGLMFVKVDGPALGTAVTSLDPAAAPDATARQEVEKISFALEMGNNVLLYLDDIQHVSPSLLQRFISLCDAQRRIEGVWEGTPRTYDLRGKRFAVCMAGNPYTESGQRFQIPDMLANRADVWNLGDVLSGREELFALSYVENALTSNPVLAPLSARSRADVELLVRLARGDHSVLPDHLSHPYSPVELDQILSVLRKLLRVQEVVLACNQAYIASAAQSDAARTEPPFQLQGSYRNMNKLAERVVPVMNDAELEAVIDDHYLGEAQTLASGAEANLLKLASLRGRLTSSQASRWAEVKAAYVRARALGSDADDPMSRAVGALGLLADRLAAVEAAIERTAK